MARLAHPFLEGAREDQAALISHFPAEQLTILASDQSMGLQLSDVYLWLANRALKGRGVPLPLAPLVEDIFEKGLVDGISLPLMMNRWAAFERRLPPMGNVTPEQHEETARRIAAHREKVKGLKKD
jgi:hypothetical protein